MSASRSGRTLRAMTKPCNEARWETPKAVAMILLAVAAIAVAGRVPDLLWPAPPQQILVQLHVK